MPQRGNNHASLQRTYLEEKRALGKLLKKAERRKNQPRKKAKRKKWKRRTKIEEIGSDSQPVRIHLTALNSQVYHLPLPFERDPEPVTTICFLLRMSRFLVNFGFGIVLLTMSIVNMMFCAVQLYCIWRGKLSISRLVLQSGSIIIPFGAHFFLVYLSQFLESLIRSPINLPDPYVTTLQMVFWSYFFNMFGMTALMCCYAYDVPLLMIHRVGRSTLCRWSYLGEVVLWISQMIGVDAWSIIEALCFSDGMVWEPFYVHLYRLWRVMYPKAS